jgi:hypothetical protein
MVSPKDLNADEYKKLRFKNRTVGMEWVKNNIANYKRMTKDELMAQVLLQYGEIVDSRKAMLENDMGPIKPLDKKFHVDFNGKSPIFVQIRHTDLFYLFESKEITSNNYKQLYNRLKDRNLLNRVVYSEDQLQRFKRKVQRTAGDVQLCFHEQPILVDDVLGKYYIINNIFDYGKYLLNQYTTEAQEYQTYEGIRLRCVLCCIRDQLKPGPRTIQKLDQFNNEEITLDKLKEISESLKICIRVYDCEMNKWREYDNNSGKSKAEKVVSIVVNNGHAYNLISKYKSYTNFREKQKTVCLSPFDENDPKELTTIYKEFEFKNNKLIISTEKGVYYSKNDPDFKEIIKYFIKHDIYPGIISNRSRILSLHVSNKYELRNGRYKHEYINFVPLKYNLTKTSCSKYYFKTFIKQSLICLTNEMYINIFKSMCTPINNIETVNLTGFIYQVDINKAYRYFSNNIGLFEETPKMIVIDKIYTNEDQVRNGIYYCDNRWITNEQLEYKLQTQQTFIHYAIYYDIQSNVIHDFAEAIYDDQFDILDQDKKVMFNSFIGTLHPHKHINPNTIIFKSELDLDRFLLSDDNKIIMSLEKVESSYIVEFRYVDDLNGTNLQHIPAQIISRCKLHIEKYIQVIKNRYPDVVIVGTMTDSIIFKLNEELDHTLLPVGPHVGQFSLVTKKNIIAAGIGQYCLYDNLQDTTYIRFQGVQDPDERIIERLREKNANALDNVIKSIKESEPVAIIEASPVNDKEHQLIIGSAGCGKSFYIKNTYKDKTYIKLASTGVASCNIKCSTVSSYFCLGHMNSNSVVQSLGLLQKKMTRIQEADGFIIDECYTLTLATMKKVNEILKLVCCTVREFGNKEFIFVGDDRQLVGNYGGEVPFMFSDLYKSLTVTTTEIPYSHYGRLSYDYHVLLHSLRTDLSQSELLNFIRSLNSSKNEFDAIMVTYTNADVDEINRKRYKKFEGVESTFDGRNYKVGMPVMLTRNALSKKSLVYNGRIGKLVSYNKSLVLDITENNASIQLNLSDYHDWTPAFAITIHKVQSLTLPNINIILREEHLSHPDSTRLLYVALSRVKDIKNVYIKIVE